MARILGSTYHPPDHEFACDEITDELKMLTRVNWHALSDDDLVIYVGLLGAIWMKAAMITSQSDFNPLEPSARARRDTIETMPGGRFHDEAVAAAEALHIFLSLHQDPPEQGIAQAVRIATRFMQSRIEHDQESNEDE